MSLPYISPKQLARAKRLIRAECSNYDAKHNECFALDEGDGCVCVQSISYSLLCKWFRECILPLDPKLQMELCPPANRKRCQLCGKEYVPSGRNARYCPECAAKKRRELDRERKRRIRQKHPE